MKKLVLGLAALMALLCAAFGWLFLSGSTAPASAPGIMNIAEWRALVAADRGGGPQRIGWLEIGHDHFPSFVVQAGRFDGPVAMSFNSVELAWPEQTILIDAAVDAQVLQSMAQTKEAAFYDSAYQSLLGALSRASRILITHEHMDHVIGIVRHPDPVALAPRLALTQVQRDSLSTYAPEGEPLPEAISNLVPVEFSAPTRIAAGVVVIPMSGHSPGSQMIYVQRADGAEFLFIGDIAWTMRNIEELTTRPVALNYFVFDPPEVRENVLDQLRGLHDLMASEPGLTIVPAHDRDYLLKLVEDGRLSTGFMPVY